jgi:hypothetical protein
VAEGAPLLRAYRGNFIEGSNPSLSAIYRVIIGPVGSIINLHTQIHTHKFWLALASKVLFAV